MLLYVKMLAGNDAFLAPIAGDPQHSPRYKLMLYPGQQSAALYKKKKKSLAGVCGSCSLELGHPRDEGAKGGG